MSLNQPFKELQGATQWSSSMEKMDGKIVEYVNISNDSIRKCFKIIGHRRIRLVKTDNYARLSQCTIDNTLNGWLSDMVLIELGASLFDQQISERKQSKNKLKRGDI